jgi:hypothetical protein
MRVCVAAVVCVFLAGCSPMALSSEEQDVVTVIDNGTPITSYSFGTVMGSATHDFVIGPASGSDDDYLLSIGFQNACPDFGLTAAPPMMWEICGPPIMTVAPLVHTQCTPFPFSVTFTPQSAGLQSCKILIDTMPAAVGSNGSGSGSGTALPQSFLVSGTGSAATLDYQVNPPSLDFGTITVNSTSSSQSFTIRNLGTLPIMITPTPIGQTGSYAITPPLIPETIPVATSRTFDVTCTPLAGANNASYQFSAVGLQGTKTLTLSCTGVTTQLAVAPNPIAFGTVLFGGSVAPVPLTITNNGLTTLQITNIGLGAGTSADVSLISAPPSLMLAPGASAPNAFSVGYSAATLQDPGTLGKLTLTVGAEVLEFPITGGTLVGAVGTNPASVDFGPVCVERTATQDVDVYASGRADVSVGLDANSPPALPFSATLSAGGMLTGGHGAGATIVVSAHPGASDLGPLSTQVVLDTNIPGQPTYTIDVAASGVAAGVSATPTAVEFGDIVMDTTSTAKRVDLSNCSGAPLMVASAALSGTDASSFAIVSPSSNEIAQTLKDSDSETFLIVMSPHASGPKVASLDITDSTGTRNVELRGTGVEPEVDRETYYACSTSNGRAAWPIGLVLAITVGRRRRSRARARTSEYPSAH